MSGDRKEIHVVPREDGRWSVKRKDAMRASAILDTKKEAMERARELAKKGQLELIPHREDGKISNPNSFGDDSKYHKDSRH